MGVRTRLALTLVALVAVTVTSIGIGVYAFVEASLRDGLIADARHQANFNLSVLLPATNPPPTDAAAFAASGLPEAFRLRGDVETIADFGDGDVYVSTLGLQGALAEVSPELRAIVGSGELGYAWQALRGRNVLVVGGRQGDLDRQLYFVFDAQPVDDAVAQLRVGLLRRGADRDLGGAADGGRDRAGDPASRGRGRARGAPDRGGRPRRAGARGRPRRVRALGGGVQPHGGLARGHGRQPRGRPSSRTAVSSPTSPTSCGPRSRPSSPRPR